MRNVACVGISFVSGLLHLFYHFLQLIRHRRKCALLDLHLTVCAATDDDVVLSPLRVLVGEVFAELRAPAFFSQQRSAGNRFRHDHHVSDIDRRVPAVVILALACYACSLYPRALLPDRVKRLLHFTLDADNPNEILHSFLQIVLDLIWVLAGMTAVKGSKGCCCRGLKLRLVDRYRAVSIGEFCGKAPRALSEYDEVRQGIS